MKLLEKSCPFKIKNKLLEYIINLSSSNDLKIAKILAYGKYFCRAKSTRLFGIPGGTYDCWLNKSKKDQELGKLVEIEYKKLVEKVDEEIFNSIKIGLKALNQGFENHPFDETDLAKKNWGYNIDSASKAIKNIGEIAIAQQIFSVEEEVDGDED